MTRPTRRRCTPSGLMRTRLRSGIRDSRMESRMTERSLVLIKPDGVQRLLVGRVIARFEDRGLKLVGLKLVSVSRELAERHYAIHRDCLLYTSDAADDLTRVDLCVRRII